MTEEYRSLSEEIEKELWGTNDPATKIFVSGPATPMLILKTDCDYVSLAANHSDGEPRYDDPVFRCYHHAGKEGQSWHQFVGSLATIDTVDMTQDSGGTDDPFTSRSNRSETRYQHRRGRGKRRNDAYWTDHNSRDDTDPFDGRECLFADGNGNARTPAMANLDTGLKVPGGLIMSSQYAKELGRCEEISEEFVDPCLRSISGHMTPVTGILRDVVFRLKGTSVTFKRDFFICDAIDGLVDIMFGASFIKDQFKLLFERVKECFSTFATWFSTKKESTDEKAERERREREQKMKANQREIARLQKEQHLLQTAQRQSQEGAGGRQ